ncbi:MAG: dUTP diphosphatase [Oscillospiraceae bacterium]|nr:dUTP diphosphatase [Candidatus Ruminococcus equi]
MSEIKIKKLNENAIIPTRATNGSAGLDLYACLDSSETILPSETKLIKTGIAISIEKDFVAYVYARSGLAVKKGITLANCVGVIDSDYRGEVCVALHNISKEAYEVKNGERIAQLVIQKVEYPTIIETENLDETKRGEGGFGSTG